MSTPPYAIDIQGLSKCYQLGEELRGGGKWSRAIARRIARAVGVQPAESLEENEVFWALRDVSFRVQPGEVVGIVGKNGAGKSTLLKLLSRVTDPTCGEAKVYGRVASLLEVGTGFHPELTGQQNVYLNGSLLGLTHREVKQRYNQIVDFAEMQRFMTTPVKRYSSGMYVRLAFAVAAHLDPEVMIVDEVLAVGDAAFQEKCLGKLDEVADSGRTVLFVSHNMPAVRQFCQRAIWLKNGEIQTDGDASTVVNLYETDAPHAQNIDDIQAKLRELPRDENVRLTDVTLKQDGRPGLLLSNGAPAELSISFEVFKPTPNLRVLVDLIDQRNQWVFRTFHDGDGDAASTVQPGHYRATLAIPANFLAPKPYTLRIGAAIYGKRRCMPDYLHVPIDVRATGRVDRAYPAHQEHGSLQPHMDWSLQSVDASGQRTRSLAA